MKRRFDRSLVKKGKSLLCAILAVCLVTGCLWADGMAVTASGEERTFDIGVNPESVTAVLSESGLLTVSGSGEIRDFTADTAPFAGSRVTAVKLGADVKAIGSYTFYNCAGLTGTVTLPKGIIRIGDGAFSGESLEKAPKPGFVENLFEELTVTRKKPEPTASPESDPEPVSSGVQEETASQPEPVSPAEPATESSAAEVEEAEEPAEESAVSQPEPVENSAPSSAPETEDSGNRYLIETITQQEIGENIFYPRTDRPAFLCSSGNGTFRAALEAAGYREATEMISAAFGCGAGSCSEGQAVVKPVPVVDGGAILPGVLPEFSAPEGGTLVSYTFGGWTEAQDGPGVVRAAGSVFPVKDGGDLYFIANWNREVLLKIAVKRDGDALVLSVPETEGYDLTDFRWQSCVLPAGEKIPADQELLSWKDISGETGQTCRVSPKAAAGTPLYRCVLKAKRQQNLLAALFSGDRQEELALDAVSDGEPGAETGSGSQPSRSAAIAPGRSFGQITSTEKITVSSQSALTAGFVTAYQPSGGKEGALCLYKKDGETLSSAEFPAGTRLILCDMTADGAYRYYSCQAPGGGSAISLSAFGYPAPSGTETISEKLLFVLDFSGAGMPQGDYTLALTHGETQPEAGTSVEFAVVGASGGSLTVTKEEAATGGVWSFTVTPGVPQADTRYSGGVCVYVSLTQDGEAVGFPKETIITGGVENIAQDGSGFSFTLPADSPGAVTLDFSGVPQDSFPTGEYQLNAVMKPRVGLQMGSDAGISGVSAEPLSFTRASVAEAVTPRSIGVTLAEDSQRLLEVSEEPAELKLQVEYRDVQDGDKLTVDILQKVGDTPEDSSYVKAYGWAVSPMPEELSGSGETVTVTVPKGQKAGTYRVRLRIVDAAGNTVAEQPYNFIVK